MGLEIFVIDFSPQNHDLFQNEKCKLFFCDSFFAKNCVMLNSGLSFVIKFEMFMVNT